MEAIPTTFKKKDGTTWEGFTPSMSVEELNSIIVRESPDGFCLACGAEVYGVEPDMRRGECEGCGARKVYGLEELGAMGYIRVTD